MSRRGFVYQAGQMVGGTNLRVVRPFGEGGMGSVYEVEELSVGKLYVMKVIHPEFARGPKFAARMTREAKFLAKLEHENIVQVFWAGETQDKHRLPYYVMERLSGRTLRDAIRSAAGQQRALSLRFAVEVATDLLSALSYAHRNGVIHRDVKPENIFLHKKSDGTTVTKLLDFGILALASDDAQPTSAGFKGTLRYATPEQIRSDKPTPRTDLYAAGLVLYEMIAGRGPFDEHGSSMAIAAAHLRDNPPPVSQWRRVPAALDELVASALAKDPESRPSDGAAFLASLASIRAALDEPEGARDAAFEGTGQGADEGTLESLGDDVQGTPSEMRPQANSWVDNPTRTVLPADDGSARRRRGLVALVATLAALSGFSIWLFRDASTSRIGAETPMPVESETPATRPSTTGTVAEPVASAPSAPPASPVASTPSPAPSTRQPERPALSHRPPTKVAPTASTTGRMYDPYANP